MQTPITEMKTVKFIAIGTGYGSSGEWKISKTKAQSIMQGITGRKNSRWNVFMQQF